MAELVARVGRLRALDMTASSTFRLLVSTGLVCAGLWIMVLMATLA